MSGVRQLNRFSSHGHGARVLGQPHRGVQSRRQGLSTSTRRDPPAARGLRGLHRRLDQQRLALVAHPEQGQQERPETLQGTLQSYAGTPTPVSGNCSTRSC